MAKRKQSNGARRLKLLTRPQYTAAEIARRLGVSHTAVYNWRVGSEVPSPAHRKALAKLGIPVGAWE
jgi:transposase-like protein